MSESKVTRDIFQDDGDWMEKQPFMRPWDEGCRTLDSMINKWMDELANEVFTSATVDRGPMRERIWNCWSYHWQKDISRCGGGAVDPLQVAARLRGQVPNMDQKTGEDLIRDCILAEAAIQGDKMAIECLESYLDRAGRRHALRVEPFIMQTDWRQEVLIALVGNRVNVGSLAKFNAKGSLQAYLNIIVCRFLIRASEMHRKDIKRLQRKMHNDELYDTPKISTGYANSQETMECNQLLTGLIGKVLADATDRQQLVFYSKLIHRRSNTEIARMLNRDKAQVKRTLDPLYKKIAEIVQNGPNGDTLQSCIKRVFGGDGGPGSLPELIKRIMDVLQTMMNDEAKR